MSDKEDFLKADIDELMNAPPEDVEDRGSEIDRMYSEYDRKLMSFTPTAKRRTWPQPIR